MGKEPNEIKDSFFDEVPAASPANDYPMSYQQERVFRVVREVPGANNVTAVLTLRGKLDTGVLEQALYRIVERHSVLRSVFFEREGTFRQRILPSVPIDFSVERLTTDHSVNDLTKFANEEANQTFRLADGHSFRVKLVSYGADEHLLFLTFSHIACDTWSVACFVYEMLHIYCAQLSSSPIQLPERFCQMVDYAVWQKKKLDNLDEDLLSKARNHYESFPAARSLSEICGKGEPSNRFFCFKTSLSADTVRQLQFHADANGLKLFSILMSIFAKTVSVHTGQDRFLFLVPTHGRKSPNVANSIGYVSFNVPVEFESQSSNHELAKVMLTSLQEGRQSFLAPFAFGPSSKKAKVQFNFRAVPHKNIYPIPGSTTSQPLSDILYTKLSLKEFGLQINDPPIFELHTERKGYHADLMLIIYPAAGGALDLHAWYRSHLDSSFISDLVRQYSKSLVTLLGS